MSESSEKEAKRIISWVDAQRPFVWRAVAERTHQQSEAGVRAVLAMHQCPITQPSREALDKVRECAIRTFPTVADIRRAEQIEDETNRQRVEAEMRAQRAADHAAAELSVIQELAARESRHEQMIRTAAASRGLRLSGPDVLRAMTILDVIESLRSTEAA